MSGNNLTVVELLRALLKQIPREKHIDTEWVQYQKALRAAIRDIEYLKIMAKE